MFAGATPTKFGRLHHIEQLAAERMHFHDQGDTLREVTHVVPIPVLDQEDLDTQGIDTSQLIPGAPKVKALGSCTANATTASLAERTVAAGKPLPPGLSASDAVKCEEWAIRFYEACTHQTGNPDQEWPPTDCGSTGQACCEELERLRLATSYRAPQGVLGALSALQAGTVIQGTPWFHAWMEPDSEGYVDGDGSLDALKSAIDSGVAGGHETCQRGIAQLAVTHGRVDLANTIIRVRNSWSEAFCLAGDFLLHASTLGLLASYVDYKQFVI